MTSTIVPAPPRDVVILGAGLGGLLTAALLRQRAPSLTITLIDVAEIGAGGRATTHTSHGASCNLGPHALYNGGELLQALRELDLEPAGRIPSDPVTLHSPSSHPEAPLFPFPASPLGLLRSPALTHKDRWQLARALFGMMRDASQTSHQMSASAWLDTLAQPGSMAHSMLCMLTRIATYSADLDHLDAFIAQRQLHRVLRHNVRYLDGGWQTMIDALHARLQDDPHLQLMPHTHTRDLEIDAEDLITLHLDHTHDLPRQLQARHLVLATPPRATARLLDAYHPAISAAIDALVPMRAACLDLVLRKDPRHPLPSSLFSLDAPYYFSVHSRTAHLSDDPDVEVLHVAKYLIGKEKDAIPELERWLDGLFPQWRSRVLHRHASPSLKVTHHLPMAGQPHPADPIAARLPSTLHLVGDWCAPESHLADAVAWSAQHAASRLMAHLTPPLSQRSSA